MDLKKVYFPNLNGLRFFAAFLVIVHHIEHLKALNNLPSYFKVYPFVDIIGKLGVILFFVLSGFLITYLLLAEEKVQNRISIRAFYIRRILRIWPLYFFIILLALGVFPHLTFFTLPGFGKDVVYDDLLLKIIFYVFFFPNLVVELFGAVPYASHTWSIGTEEQYYLVWPVILKLVRRYRMALMAFIILIYLFILLLLQLPVTDFLPYKFVINAFWSYFNIDCMAIGGFFAILLFQKSRFLKIFMNPWLFYAALIAALTMMLFGVYVPYLHYETYAILFGIIVLNFAANPRIKISLENPVFNYLGKISYGIYMYHPIGIVLSISIAVSLGWVTNWFIYPLSLLATILLSALSYRYLESGFLRLKTRFSKIQSGDQAKKP